MRLLPHSFNEDGFAVRMIKRSGRVAMLAKSKPEMRDFYEVVQIQQRPEETIHGKLYPAREVMPRPEQWGNAGWSCYDKEQAELKFEALTRKGGLQGEGIA